MRILALLALLPGLALAATQTITENPTGDFTGVEDTRLAESAPTTPQGASTTLATSSFSVPDDLAYTLIKFDLSNLPASITITDAQLRLYKKGGDTDGESDDISAYRSKRTAVYTQATWNEYSSGNSWQTAGAEGANDVDTTATDTVSIPDTVGYYSWDVTVDVQDFYAGTETNEGWVLKTDVETDGDYIQWSSSEDTSGQRPELVVTYSTGATLSLDDATPEAGVTVAGTLSQALAGGNPTKVVFGSADEVTCDSATATTCTFTLTLSQFSNTGTLNNTQWAVAGTVKASDGTNETSTTPITIGVPTAGLMVDLACTAGTNCDAGSEAVSPMATNDDCAVVVNSGSALSSLTTHCQPLFAGPSSNYTVYQFDESATAWLEQNAGTLSPPPSSCNHGVVQSVVNDVVQDTVEAPICE